MRRIRRRAALVVCGLIIGGSLISLSPACRATDYYVAPTGSDANPGTFGQPWKTIRQANRTIGPGDTAYFRAGTYHVLEGSEVDGREDIRILKTGTAANPRDGSGRAAPSPPVV